MNKSLEKYNYSKDESELEVSKYIRYIHNQLINFKDTVKIGEYTIIYCGNKQYRIEKIRGYLWEYLSGHKSLVDFIKNILINSYKSIIGDFKINRIIEKI